jgi:hypothetical protein
MQRIFGKIEIADQTDQRCQRPARLVAKYFIDLWRCHGNALLERHSGVCSDEPGMTIEA